MTRTVTVVLDRIVDGQTAVLLFEGDDPREDGGVDSREFHVPVSQLPADGRTDGAVYEAELADDELRSLEYQPETTADRRRAAQDRFDRLSERLGDE